MADNLLLSSFTRRKIDTYKTKPSQALLLVGKKGSQKTQLAHYLAASLLETTEEKLVSNPNFTYIHKKDGQQNITIGEIRDLKSSIKLKSHRKGEVKRVVFIEDAGYLNQEAQNSLLKALEEPSSGTFYILTASSISSLLLTIISRCLVIKVQPITLKEASDYYSTNKFQDVESAWHLSEGEAGLLNELINEASHDLKSSISNAKEFLKMPRYSRFVMLDKLTSNKEEALDFLDALSKLIRALYVNSAATDNTNLSKKLLVNAKLLIEAKAALNGNVNSRLCLLNLAINLTI